MPARSIHLAFLPLFLVTAAASPAHAETAFASAGELTQISVESKDKVDVFHLLDIERGLAGGEAIDIMSEGGAAAQARLHDETLVLSANGFDYRLPLALLPGTADLATLPDVKDVTIPGREYTMTFARDDGSKDVVKVQRRFTGLID